LHWMWRVAEITELAMNVELLKLIRVSTKCRVAEITLELAMDVELLKLVRASTECGVAEIVQGLLFTSVSGIGKLAILYIFNIPCHYSGLLPPSLNVYCSLV
jgi:hypothetical protein